MDHQYPIYTVATECQDCYKCVRHCPVKAIKVEGHRASVVPELCSVCGHCVEVCPAHAKKVRDDLGRARHLLESRKQVFVSLAPSWVSEFTNVSAASMIGALKRLGFAGVGETALGAQQVSAAVSQMLNDKGAGVYLSSACPAAVEFVNKYVPQHAHLITDLLSPVLVHSKMLRQEFGQDIGVVFIGPCVAKKHEADQYRDVLDLALTFEDLHRWFAQREIVLEDVAVDTGVEEFVLADAYDGALYPIEGGMAESVRACGVTGNVEFVNLTGLRNIERALTSTEIVSPDRPVFVECLACEGGCVNGPCMSRKDGGLAGRLKVVSTARQPSEPVNRDSQLPREAAVQGQAIRPRPLAEEHIRQALRSVGKTRQEDMLNCGGCGYETCRAFARAILEGKAEPAMCVSFLRKQAQKKANALLRCMPSAGVIVDADLRIIECNARFAELFGDDTQYAFESLSGLEGAVLSKVVEFIDLFNTVLRSGGDLQRENYRSGERLLNINVFTIEPHQVIGAIIQDVTKAQLHREQIARRAREVIHKNLATVQEIASRLGEHMADTEILLHSIAQDYPDAQETQEADAVQG